MSEDKLLSSAEELVTLLRQSLDIDAAIRLWDGTTLPLGCDVESPIRIAISSPGVVSSLLRRPTLDRLIRHYAHGQIDLEGGTLLDIGEQLAVKSTRKRIKKIKKRDLAKQLWPFLLAPAEKPGRSRDFLGDETGEGRIAGENKDFIQFHYDVGNDFYRLFLDPEMQYSCAYFTSRDNDLATAQRDKLEMICRKLRLKRGERLLDIGCGWGGLICYAAQNYAIEAHGVTLSEEQLAVAREKITELGLEDRVTVELKDYADLEGRYDKIASVGMYEHIGVKNIATYLQKIKSLLVREGLFLNHAISRRAKKSKQRFSKRAEQRALLKYIFPGGELDDIGHTVQAMEQEGFEVHDVENWREHYALTTRQWCERLTNERERAISLVGDETYRIWVAYLAGCSLAFTRGTARIYQTLVSRQGKGLSPLPPTRVDLYR